MLDSNTVRISDKLNFKIYYSRADLQAQYVIAAYMLKLFNYIIKDCSSRKSMTHPNNVCQLDTLRLNHLTS